MLLFLALVAMSADTATKVLHGIAHQRESHEWMAHGVVAHPHSRASEAAEVQRSSVDALDVDDDHVALHGAVTATVLPSLLMAVAVIIEMPIAAFDTEREALPHWVAQTAPPWVRARSTKPRAPPLS
ncbi:MAG: hypothetical protein ABIT38_20380 [Gemmatimonadaceae bacterium]